MTATDEGYKIALQEAREGSAEGGIPVGGCIVGRDGTVLGRGRNTRIQDGSIIKHGETAAFESAKHLQASAFEGSTIYTTLSPCPMCAGSMIWFKVSKVVIGENQNMSGREELLKSHGIEVVVLNEPESKKLMDDYKVQYPERWGKV